MSFGYGVSEKDYNRKPRKSFKLYKDLVAKESGSNWKNSSNSIAEFKDDLAFRHKKRKRKFVTKTIIILVILCSLLAWFYSYL